MTDHSRQAEVADAVGWVPGGGPSAFLVEVWRECDMSLAVIAGGELDSVQLPVLTICTGS